MQPKRLVQPLVLLVEKVLTTNKWLMLTIKQARKVLGKSSVNLSDEQLQKELEVASFLSELLFEKYFLQKGTSKVVKGK